MKKTIQNYDLALKSSLSSNPYALESINLQRDYYEKQLNLLNLKQNFKSQKIDKQKKIDDDEVVNFKINERVEKSTMIQLDLFKNIESADKYFEELKNSLSNDEHLKELQKLNSQFNYLFYQLTTYVEDTVQENEILKDKLKTLSNIKSDISHTASLEENKRRIAMEDLEDNSPAEEECQELPPLDLPEFELDSIGQ